MPYLSRIWLNPLRSGAQRLLRSPQVTHAAVLGGIPEQPVEERVLWRLEPVRAHRMTLFVLTRSAPSWEHLVEQAGWPGAEIPQAETRPYESLLSRVVSGREFALRVRVNPIESTRNPQSPSASHRATLDRRRRGVVVPHVTAAQQTRWLLERFDSWGFEPLRTQAGDADVRLVNRERLVFSKRADATPSRRVTLSTATFEGRVVVVDAERARRSLLDGVGRAKAYGCGLITLAPCRPCGEV